LVCGISYRLLLVYSETWTCAGESEVDEDFFNSRSPSEEEEGHLDLHVTFSTLPLNPAIMIHDPSIHHMLNSTILSTTTVITTLPKISLNADSTIENQSIGNI